MWYIVISSEIYSFCSRSEAEQFYKDKEADGFNPFATQDMALAAFIAYDTNPLF